MKPLKKHTKETIIIGIALVVLSIILHYVHYKMFNDLHHTMIFLVADIAFIPMEIFLTAFVIEKLLDKRERAHRFEKLITIKGVFFSEFGTELLDEFIKCDEDIQKVAKVSQIDKNWDKRKFENLKEVLGEHDFKVNPEKINIEKISKILDDNKDFIISIITNSTLMEHEEFSELANSLFYLRDELQDRYFRMECECEVCDKEHIAKQINISYKYMVYGWVLYMQHLNMEYPELFVRAMLKNPFDRRSFEEKFEVYKIRKRNEVVAV